MDGKGEWGGARVKLRRAGPADLEAMLALYAHLHGEGVPDVTPGLMAHWRRIAAEQQVLLAEVDGVPAASCVLVVVPNLSRGQRPYGLVENVVTHPDYRRRGLASALLEQAREWAQAENCYKLMLMTGRSDPGVLRLYERAGYNRHDKTAFVLWLGDGVCHTKVGGAEAEPAAGRGKDHSNETRSSGCPR